MTIQVINNGEDGLVVRNKINNNFTELENSITTGILGTANNVDGFEVWIATQNGGSTDITAQQVSGDPVRSYKSLAMNRRRGYTNFIRTTSAFSATDGAIIGGEPWSSHFSGTGASILTTKFLAAPGGLILTTGTTATGYAGIQHLDNPLAFDPNKSMVTTFKGGFNTTNLPDVEDQVAVVGFTSPVTALPTYGMYFEATAASPNWFAVVRRDASNATKKDTGVPYTFDFTKRFRVVFDPTVGSVQNRFYIDDALVATILSTERLVPTLAGLYMTAQIRKVAGTTTGGLAFTDHSYDVQTDELVGF